MQSELVSGSEDVEFTLAQLPAPSLRATTRCPNHTFRQRVGKVRNRNGFIRIRAPFGELQAAMCCGDLDVARHPFAPQWNESQLLHCTSTPKHKLEANRQTGICS